MRKRWERAADIAGTAAAAATMTSWTSWICNILFFVAAPRAPLPDRVVSLSRVTVSRSQSQSLPVPKKPQHYLLLTIASVRNVAEISLPLNEKRRKTKNDQWDACELGVCTL